MQRAAFQEGTVEGDLAEVVIRGTNILHPFGLLPLFPSAGSFANFSSLLPFAEMLLLLAPGVQHF